MATLYKVNGTVETVAPENGQQFTLEEMQKLIGGYVERIRLRGTHRMVVDEDGTLRGLPPNKGASLVLKEHLGPGVVRIVGPALVGDKKEFGLG